MRGRKMIRNLVNTYQLLSARGREERRRSPEGGRYAPEGPRRVQRGREGPHQVHLVAEWRSHKMLMNNDHYLT